MLDKEAWSWANAGSRLSTKLREAAIQWNPEKTILLHVNKIEQKSV